MKNDPTIVGLGNRGLAGSWRQHFKGGGMGCVGSATAQVHEFDKAESRGGVRIVGNRYKKDEVRIRGDAEVIGVIRQRFVAHDVGTCANGLSAEIGAATF